MIKSAKNLPIQKLLSKDDNNKELFYKIPPYQREYSWKKEQFENIFDDINDNDIGYFLGSIIAIDKGDYLELIDGQQRLTTLSILLNALLNIINKYDSQNPKVDIINPRKNKLNGQAYYILQDILHSNEIERPKISLSIQKENQDDYEYLLFINGLIPNKIKPAKLGHRRIYKAYEYFKYRLEELDENGDKLFDIKDVFEFLDKLFSVLIVKIEVNDIASAFTLFESINNRGIPLTPIDLIKNSIIGKMELIDKPANITNQKWQNIVNNIEGYDDQVRFLRHYYHAFKYLDKINQAKYSKATKSNIIHIYSDLINQDVECIFTDLINKSTTYSIFVHPEQIIEDKFQPFKNKLIDLQKLGIAPAYTLLLYLFEEKFNEEQIFLAFDFIENWFIRRSLCEYPGTNKLDQIFLDLNKELILSPKEETFEVIKKFMTTKDRYRSDGEFENVLKNEDLYTTSASALRCLLIKLEKSKRTKENNTNFWEIKNNKQLWSVEHILPQNPHEKSNWRVVFDEEEMKKHIHKLGNLTLTCYNSNLSNKSFKEKSFIQELGKEVGLKSKNVFINEYLLDIEIWNKDSIRVRSGLISNEIIEMFNRDI